MKPIHLAKTDADRARFWQAKAEQEQVSAEYYQAELVKAHALLGRVVHQLSERWDTVNLTQYYPTDNLNRDRSVSRPGGRKE
jgi:hypothetical protein